MVRAKGMGYRVAEVPISFVDRSKITVQFGTADHIANSIKCTGSLS